ncbi:CesT family type III secretion system chaperone [Horticoccus sp. 23ND18S-11]|uniref:CesT family type III secretion system chaperone n=1 Tax=Horticoccus sp. 23ND18S-11 TaxID=3391832 RepID=UPI0039C9CC36
MNPHSLVTTLLRDRGVTDAFELPARAVFDHTHVVTFSELPGGWIGLTCAVDAALPGHDPALALRLLEWNRDPAIVGGGGFALAADGVTVLFRLSVPAAALDLEQFKALIDALLERVERLGAALIATPDAIDPALFDAAPQATAFLGADMISV